jgi:hypothetical protein
MHHCGIYHFFVFSSLHWFTETVIGQDSSIAKIASTSAKSVFDFFRLPFNWLSSLAASIFDKSVPTFAEFSD